MMPRDYKQSEATHSFGAFNASNQLFIKSSLTNSCHKVMRICSEDNFAWSKHMCMKSQETTISRCINLISKDKIGNIVAFWQTRRSSYVFVVYPRLTPVANTTDCGIEKSGTFWLEYQCWLKNSSTVYPRNLNLF